MKELYLPVVIPNFVEIQKELHNAIDHDYKEKTQPYAFTYSKSYMEEKCPIFMSWLKPRLKLPVRIFRYYITPPGKSLGPHIDGFKDLPVPFGLNIPVSGTKNTFHNVYECDPDNIEVRSPNGYLTGLHPKDENKLKLIESLEILTPCIINNSVMHGVVNKSNEFRIMFTVRWLIHPTIGREVNECLDIGEVNA